MTLVLQADHATDLFLTDVRMQLVDRAGGRGPDLGFTRPHLIARFGS